MKKLTMALALVIGSSFAGAAYACDCAKKQQEKQASCTCGSACPGACPGKGETPPPKDTKGKPDKKS
jgi:hypothetical protein